MVAVIGGGPAGLMAAEVLAAGGARVELFDSMPSVGRKFLLAGKGGLNLTHSEPLDTFVQRFGPRRLQLEPMLRQLGPTQLRSWAQGLGTPTFVGSSGRVFPLDMKAAPLLRAWLRRLRELGVVFHMRHRWIGWGDSRLNEPSDSKGQFIRFMGPNGPIETHADAVVLAVGGASWSRLGSDGRWTALLEDCGVDVAPLRPSNCGFDVARVGQDGTVSAGWSEYFRTRFAGHPMKTVALSLDTPGERRLEQRGEFVITADGVEGSLVYALSAHARDAIAAHGQVLVYLDLLPDRSAEFVRDEVVRPRGSRSMSTHLKSRLGLDGVKAALLHELLARETFADPDLLSKSIKSLALTLIRARPIDEAISTAGGVRFETLDEGLMLRALEGIFCCGEMLDWEAPTGGYLLTACLASGDTAARAVLRYLETRRA
jgi:uncharacterized flavoprotein (TIGR03862 family)